MLIALVDQTEAVRAAESKLLPQGQAQGVSPPASTGPHGGCCSSPCAARLTPWCVWPRRHLLFVASALVIGGIIVLIILGIKGECLEAVGQVRGGELTVALNYEQGSCRVALRG